MPKPTSQFDPSAKIPPAVTRAAKAADDLHHTLYKKDDVEGDDPKQEDVDGGEKAAEAKAEEPTPAEQDAKNLKEPKTEAKDVTPTSNTGTDDFEHKYNSLKGRYDRAMEQLRGQGEQLSQLMNEVKSLRASADKAPDPSISARPLSSLTPEEIADYGDEFLNVVGKKARDIVTPEVEALRKQVAELTGRLEGVNGYVANSARDRLHEELDDKIPQWRDLNANNDFLDWLKLPDPYSGAIRHELLKQAYANNQTSRVLAFFKGFLNEEAVVAPAPQSAAPSQDRPGKVKLKDLAAPGKATSSAASRAPDEKPIITRAQIQSFYTDVAMGKYRGKEGEKDKLEQMIVSAQAEGRIR